MHIIKTELYKFYKRKWYLYIIILMVLPIFYTVATLTSNSDSMYSGQSFFYWMSTVIFTNIAFYVLQLVFFIIIYIDITEELDNHYFNMILTKLGGKLKAYRVKLISNMIKLSILYVLLIFSCILLYLLMTFIGSENITGTIFGKGFNIEIIALIIVIYLLYCIVFPNLVSLLSLFTSPNMVFIISISALFITRMLEGIKIFRYILPWSIVLYPFGEIRTHPGGNNIKTSLFFVIFGIIYTIVTLFICNIISKTKLKKLPCKFNN